MLLQPNLQSGAKREILGSPPEESCFTIGEKRDGGGFASKYWPEDS